MQGIPVVADALLVAWRKEWLPTPADVVTTTLRDGRRLQLDLADRTQRRMAMDRYEIAESRLVRAMLRPGDTFVDLGAHVGWFTTLAGRIVGPSGVVWAFEPFPRSNELLRANVALNGLDMVNAYACAVSDRDDVVSIGVQAGSDSGSVTAAPRDIPSAILAPTCRVDDIVDDDVRIRVMKIDVEGFEAHALAGARDVLSRTDAVLIELNERALVACGTSSLEIRTLLAAAGLTRQRTVPLPLSRRVRRLTGSTEPVNLVATR
jgi:FkbM family methyltransferase